MSSKACVRCGVVKPLEEFHRRAKAADGKNPACRACICAARRAYTKANQEKIRAYRTARQADPDYREARKVAARMWRELNVEHRRSYAEQYDRENAERVAAWKHAWYLANREDVLNRDRVNPEGLRSRQRRYRDRHRGLLTERQRRRRVDRLGLRVDDVDVEALWTGLCGICGGGLERSLAWPHPLSKSIDHVIPLARGGTHEAANLQWAHLRCNVSKGSRMVGELGEVG